MKSTGWTAQQNGIYRLPMDAGALHAVAGRAGLRWSVVHLRRARGKRALFSAFARALVFPATFGGNWDALADSLQDLSWLPEPGWVVVLRGASDFSVVAPDDYAVLLEILGVATDRRRQQGRVFMVLADVPYGLPALAAP